MPESQPNLIVYSDGGCRGNPGAGAWAFVVVDGGAVQHSAGAFSYTTNNRMELTAAVNALSVVVANPAWRSRRISFYCDSQYVQKGITEWISNWRRRRWKTSDKKDVKNKDLWEALDALNGQLDVEWTWVKGHANNKYNCLCDDLCNIEMDKLAGTLSTPYLSENS